MPIEVKERKDIPEQYKWDLKPLFASDEAWEEALKTLDTLPEMILSFKGKLTQSPEALLAWFEAETAADRKLENIFCYASLRESEDGRSMVAQSMMSRAYGKMVAISEAASFAEPEILSLPDETLKAYAESEVLKDYRFQMVKLMRRKAHTLSEAEEKLLAAYGDVFAGPSRLQGALEDVDMTFDPVVDKDGKEFPVTGAGYISLQNSPDRVLRENAFRSYYKTYKNHINTLANNYATSVKKDCVTAKVRHYESARAMSMAGEHVPAAVYDGLIESVHNHLPAMYRYFSLRKKILGLDDIHYYDVYAPLASEVNIQYSYEEAQQMVLDAVAPLGEYYGETVKGAFRDRWIDVYPNVGKSGGAYSSGTYDSMPYIMCNFSGTVDSVSTIAHEMGHSMHTHLSNKHQQPQNAGYTLFVAEVASTVNENLMIEQLLKKDISLEMRLYLLNQYLENFKGTIFRQTMFAEFEKIAHEKQEAGEALTAEALNQVYEDLVKLYFGPELVFDEEVRYEWARIPHFYRAFYVYKYATSYSAAVALSEGILKDGQSAVDKYLGFLSMGGSADPLDELKAAGVDMTTKAPIDRALDKFAAIVEETEKVYEALQKKA